MQTSFRISVRELVAFSYFQADILPASDPGILLKGTLAHKARQEKTEGVAEQSISHLFEMDGGSVLVYGRMDSFSDGDIPFVEEIKHCSAVPSAVLPEHRAQAMCYAAIIAAEKPCEQVCFAVVYVNAEGEILASFPETLSGRELKDEMNCLLLPFIRFSLREAVHKEARNQSIQNLSFPFENYRKGQRELAVQVYTAISRKKRLFASMPTGTGKSAAVLYPAIKAMGQEKTERIVYLTARNTARQSPLNALEKMIAQGLTARCCVLTAKEKICPAPARCHPDDCPRASGHYIRQADAINELLQSSCNFWDENCIAKLAEKYTICPFELNLALAELSDVLLMDLNYAFDPFAQVKRMFQRKKDFTLLIDEAHHTVERVRESLSGELSSHMLAAWRKEYAQKHGRKTQLYHALTQVIQMIRKIACDALESQLKQLPGGIQQAVQDLLNECVSAYRYNVNGLQDVIRICLSFLYACEHHDDDYAILLESHGRERTLTLYCLMPGKEIARVTKGAYGSIFFSATLNPLNAMKKIMGGSDEDACFALPSIFPPKNLAVVRCKICTKFEKRDETAREIAQKIWELFCAHPGNTVVFFPSYAYLNLVLKHLQHFSLPKLWIQTREMDEQNRADFLNAFRLASEPILGLCVLGGLFSEGIDLPGKQLVNAAIVGVGLPVPSARINAVREAYQKQFGDGFSLACRIPGMQKVLQAAGRVIRSETDKGIIMLLDERYFQQEYIALMPDEWHFTCKPLDILAAELEGKHD